MKTMKKVFAALVALTMVLAMGTFSAFADDSYTITVNNTSSTISIDGNTYSAYKLFDVTYSGNAYSYTADSDFATFTYSADGTDYSMDSVDNVQALLRYLESLESDSDALNAFATAVYEFITNNGISADGTATADGESATIDVTSAGAGYYLIYGDGVTTDGADETIVSAVMLTTTDPTAEVNVKADTPTIEKLIDTDGKDGGDTDNTSADIGDTVDFVITSTIPTTVAGYESYTYTITDTMSDGLTYNNDMVISVYNSAGALVSTYTTSDVLTENGQVLTVDLTDFLTTAAANLGGTVVITYSATLDVDAYDNETDETNTVYLTYSSDPYAADTTANTPESTVYVADYDIEINKYYDNDGTEEALADASFVLQNADEEYYSVDETTGVVTWVSDQDSATTVTTDANGFAQFAGLAAGTYTLTETAAPSGYNLLTDSIEVVITQESIDATGGVTATATIDGEDATVSTNADTGQLYVTVDVENTTGTVLPSTGGVGTYIFYAVGGTLMIAAFVMFMQQKKKREAWAEEA
ncbi:MAG: isopeptide-forming domain-containing fimbrial protein [Clostridiales bacterium]|nr:isopeptide-forming domain-containing fimbrial protein [Clostridiales bacterium]